MLPHKIIALSHSEYESPYKDRLNLLVGGEATV